MIMEITCPACGAELIDIGGNRNGEKISTFMLCPNKCPVKYTLSSSLMAEPMDQLQVETLVDAKSIVESGAMQQAMKNLDNTPGCYR